MPTPLTQLESFCGNTWPGGETVLLFCLFSRSPARATIAPLRMGRAIGDVRHVALWKCLTPPGPKAGPVAAQRRSTTLLADFRAVPPPVALEGLDEVCGTGRARGDGASMVGVSILYDPADRAWG